MIYDVLRWVGIATLAYFILMQLYLAMLAFWSSIELRRSYQRSRYGRIKEMLSSRTSPPVSIVIPAYNEAAGIVDAIRSMSLVKYPRVELVVINDGSTDNTLEVLTEAFGLERVRVPYKGDIETQRVRGIYRGRGAVDLTVIDKDNGGRADALNAGINIARYPYTLCTDADVILDPECLVRSMYRVMEDRERVVAVGGNIRPINGSELELGHLVRAEVPKDIIPRMQVLEYIRTFVASRPAWSAMEALPLVSGAFGVWKRSSVIAVGGFTRSHMGEDMDLTMKIHRHHTENDIPYRIVYEPSAVIWTEVPPNIRVLRRQRIRWHRGLMTATKDYFSINFNPRYGALGMITWPGMFFFEFLAPIIEFVGWFVIPIAVLVGALNMSSFVWLLLLAFGAGLINSLAGLLIDETYGHYNSPKDASRLIVMALVENFGLRQLTVAWRIRALLGGASVKGWGNMERRGVGNLGTQGSG